MSREPTKGPETDDDQLHAPASRLDPKAHRGAPTIEQAVAGVNTPFIGKTTPPGQAVVNWLVVYTPDIDAALGAGLMTRLFNIVAYLNAVYADSEIAITVNLVGPIAVGAFQPSGQSPVMEITPACVTGCSTGFNARVFGSVERQR